MTVDGHSLHSNACRSHCYQMHSPLPQQAIGIKDTFSDFKGDGDTEEKRLRKEWEGKERGEWQGVLIKIHHISMYKIVKE